MIDYSVAERLARAVDDDPLNLPPRDLRTVGRIALAGIKRRRLEAVYEVALDVAVVDPWAREQIWTALRAARAEFDRVVAEVES